MPEAVFWFGGSLWACGGQDCLGGKGRVSDTWGASGDGLSNSQKELHIVVGQPDIQSRKLDL